ncbi:hypothetical protein F4804DRAFT_317756 [Jackrogersella minutella]|nr:hypothetical protein F4804DRAFT_317756 [Jackrogersella minutella]
MKLVSDKMVQDINWSSELDLSKRMNRIDRRIDRLKEHIDDKFSRLGRMIGEQMFTTLMANAQPELDDSRMRNSLMGKMDNNMRSIMMKLGNYPASIMTRGDLEWLKQWLIPFAGDKKEALPDSISTDMSFIPNEVAVDIQIWVQSRDSNLLWVEGPAYGEFGEVLSGVGSRIWALSEELGIPCIGFFAKTKYAFESQTMSMKDAGIDSMLYSLIIQLIDIVSATFAPVEVLSEDVLRMYCDG